MQFIYNSIGFLLSQILRYRFRVSIQNIARSFPRATYQEVSEYHKSFYQNLGRILIESLFVKKQLLYLTRGTKEQLAEIANENKNIILILGHYGNWELIKQLPLSTNIKVQALYKPLQNKYWNRKMKSIREKYGLCLIPSSQALRILLKEKDNPSITVFIADQFPGKNNGTNVDFLHQQTQVYTGAEQIAHKLNAHVLYGEISSYGKHKWVFSIETICNQAKNTPKNYISATFAKKLESSIKKNTSLWLWSHKRWK